MTLLGDGSWELRVLVTDLQVERSLRVKGELHVGGVMIKLVDELGKPGQSIKSPFIYQAEKGIISQKWIRC